MTIKDLLKSKIYLDIRLKNIDLKYKRYSLELNFNYSCNSDYLYMFGKYDMSIYRGMICMLTKTHLEDKL